MLTLPDKPHEVQEAFNIEEKASIIMAVKVRWQNYMPHDDDYLTLYLIEPWEIIAA